MTTEPYDIGTVRHLSVNIKVDSADADPTALGFYMLEPDGTETEWQYGGSPSQIERENEGDFYVDWTIRVPGRHFWRFTGTGNAAGNTQGEFWAKRLNSGA